MLEKKKHIYYIYMSFCGGKSRFSKVGANKISDQSSLAFLYTHKSHLNWNF